MKMSYFEDTDTLYIEFKDSDKNNDIIALTVEHASSRTDIQNLTLSGIAA